MKTPPSSLKSKPENSFRITLVLNNRMPRLDVLLLEALRNQNENQELKRITRSAFKKLFKEKRIQIKGQAARPSSAIAAGSTDVDLLLDSNGE